MDDYKRIYDDEQEKEKINAQIIFYFFYFKIYILDA